MTDKKEILFEELCSTYIETKANFVKFLNSLQNKDIRYPHLRGGITLKSGVYMSVQYGHDYFCSATRIVKDGNEYCYDLIDRYNGEKNQLFYISSIEGVTLEIRITDADKMVYKSRLLLKPFCKNEDNHANILCHSVPLETLIQVVELEGGVVFDV
jgi:hypothetical protein